MSAVARSGGLRLLACAAVLACAGIALAGFDKTQTFDSPKGRGDFRVVLVGTDLKVERITAAFREARRLGVTIGTPELRNWHVRIQFLGLDGNEYKRVEQPVQRGPDKAGEFDWNPKAFEARPGKVQVTLFGVKKEGGKPERLMWITGDIFQK
jgi:hypothetical protein